MPATGIVPAGMPGAPAGDYLPPYDPAGARALLAQAGYPGGAGLAPVSFIAGSPYDEAVAAMLRDEPRRHDRLRDAWTSRPTRRRLANDPPQLWSVAWVADYPGPNDFLGVLLGTGSTANEGHWSNAAFDAAIAEAGAASNQADATAAYARAMGDRPGRGPGRAGLLRHVLLAGAATASSEPARPGLGIMRLAGLTWDTAP